MSTQILLTFTRMGKNHPIESIYGTVAYIYHKNQPNVGAYTSPMDGMGMGPWDIFSEESTSTPFTDIARVPYSTYYWSPPVCPLIRLYCRALMLWPPQGKRMANQLLIRPAISGERYLWVEVG